MRLLLPALSFLLIAAAADPNHEYLKSIEIWRTTQERTLKSDTGWLNVAGLFWLKEGVNRAGMDPASDIVLPAGPRKSGVFTRHGNSVTYRGADGQETPLRPNRDIVGIGRLKLFVIVRGEKIGLRMRDPESKMLREFSGLKWYPIKPEARIVAKFVAQPKKIRVPNVLGQNNEEAAPGYAEFTWQGHPVRLYPVREENRLFFIFRDQTSAHGTYGAGRFLYADLPANGTVILDFNKAENPPCAFTPFATCPLPPKENRLPFAVETGERDYGHH
ncbi:MAG: DUF1684 domain-containing protein [Bryobacteraceae bacterium]